MVGCKPSRYLKENEVLIDKVVVRGVDKDLEEDALSFVPKANSKLLGKKISLGLYNTFNTKDGKYKSKRKKIGQEPAILDSARAIQASQKMSRFLQNKGYFNNVVSLKIDSLGKKKIKLTYTAIERNRFTVRNFKLNILDTALKSLYSKKYKAPIDSGEYYDYYRLEREVSNINNLFKRNGYKDFEKSYVKFKADTLFNDSINAKNEKDRHQTDIITIINNPKGSNYHQAFTMNDTYVTIKPNARRKEIKADTIKAREDLYFLDKEGIFKPQRFSDLIFFKRGALYNNDDFLKTYTRLGDLNLFQFIKTEFRSVDQDSTKLNTYIELTPAKKLSATIEGELTLSGSYLGGNAGISFMNKNFFGGGEIFEYRLKGGLEFQPTSFNGIPQPAIREKTLETSASILFPRLLAPFNISLSKYSLPKTKVILGYTYEGRQELFTTGNTYTNLNYEWRETLQKSHYYTPINISLVNSTLDSAVARAYILSGNRSALSRYESYFSLSSQYTYLYNDYRVRFGGDFIYFKGSIDLAGNLMYLGYEAFNAQKNKLGQYTVLDRPFYQYTRPEVEIRYYKMVNKRQLVTRFNIATGFAYGNTPTMPYGKLYGTGGANSLRGWRARQVGPGSFPRNDIKPQNSSDSIAIQLEQIGEMKIEANVEYRFNITRNFIGFKLDGATFLDAGNVWNITSYFDDLYPQGRFRFNRFYKELAVGTGLGLRLDLSFLVFRFDAGLKLHDPQFKENRWVIGKFFDKDFKNEYPSFRFMNYNIGIGFPF
ncbi:BamA/TamA family outer membrane protein [Solitalea sp. MAHUQ-68]|uniref:BamA/TamA family outer membrane protein n=1 Tax=Solitalea agri TaxID=2953739 RepID=A0A9X2JBJ1_9SPHI|nr:BamA/TamA family outer membrane protein [Solitalea agri]MCO4291504.1 BamA/TamA family outer membrane protein [Solitalea agri]